MKQSTIIFLFSICCIALSCKNKTQEIKVNKSQKIDAAEDIHDLWNDPSLNFKKYEKHYSMRLTHKYRLEMEVKWMNDQKTIGEFHLFKISNHYGD